MFGEYAEFNFGNVQPTAMLGGVMNRVVPVDNFLIYKNIIRLDRPN